MKVNLNSYVYKKKKQVVQNVIFTNTISFEIEVPLSDLESIEGTLSSNHFVAISEGIAWRLHNKVTKTTIIDMAC